MSQIQELDHLKIPLEDIKLATNNFSDGNFIGRGGFGRVYKGQLSNSSTSATTTTTTTTVAIKRLDARGGQGDREFLMEIVMLARYKHENLVSLVGFSEEGDEKIIVYKHEARGSLDKYLATDHLTWVKRLRICLGAARGLNYLHTDAGKEHRVLHRDIKSSNVLLNENWEGKISDFGLSKIGLTNQAFTFLVTNACGTLGYIDPLSMETGVFTKESDVYSFGVVLFEVLCGRLAYEDNRPFLAGLVKLRYEEEKLDDIILPSIREQMTPSSLQTFSKIAYQCLKKDRNDRPTIALIVEQLQLSLDCQIGRLTMTELWGSKTGGVAWSLHLDNNQKLRKITIDHHDCIFSVIFTTEDMNGSLHSTEQYGGARCPSPGEITEVVFGTDEEITGIRIGVKTFGTFIIIASIYIMTNKGGHGPFGPEPVSCFSDSWDAGMFAGFYGRAGDLLDALGCYLKACQVQPLGSGGSGSGTGGVTIVEAEVDGDTT